MLLIRSTSSLIALRQSQSVRPFAARCPLSTDDDAIYTDTAAPRRARPAEPRRDVVCAKSRFIVADVRASTAALQLQDISSLFTTDVPCDKLGDTRFHLASLRRSLQLRFDCD